MGLVSCGSQNTPGKLEISRSFAVTNTSYAGGLVVSGKHSVTGKTFSRSISDGQEIRMTLDKGIWKISAVGWDGSSNTVKKHFAGTPSCGTVNAKLENDSEIVELTINSANCNQPEFAANHVAASGELKEFKKIVTCNSFLIPNPDLHQNILNQIVDANNDSFCNSQDEDLRSNVKAIQISAVEHLPGQPAQAGFSTGCLAGDSTNESLIDLSTTPYNNHTVKLPVLNLPLMITTYRDTDCDEPIAIHHFRDGLKPRSSNFDHLLQEYTPLTAGGGLRLLLPGSDMKKVYSPFMGLLPSVKKYVDDTTPVISRFITQPTSLSSQLFGKVGFNRLVIKGHSSCGSYNTTYTLITYLTCVPHPNGQDLVITFTASGGGGSETITLNSHYYDVFITSGESSYTSQKVLMELLGYQESTPNLSNFFQLGIDDHHDDESYGALTIARDMLSGNGAGGVMGIADMSKTLSESCHATVGNKEIEIFDLKDLKTDTYRVEVSTINKVPSSFICNTNDISGGTCTNLNKKMLIYDYKESPINPIIRLEFSCDKKIGTLVMNYSTKEEYGIKTEIKRLVNWNTEIDYSYSKQRFDNLLWMKESNDDTLLREKRSMSRLMKTGSENYEIWHFDFTSQKVLTSFQQVLGWKRLKTQDGEVRFLKDEKISTGGANAIFDDTNLVVFRTTVPTQIYTDLADIDVPYFTPGNDPSNPEIPSTQPPSDFGSNSFETTNINGNLPFKPGTLGLDPFINSFVLNP